MAPKKKKSEQDDDESDEEGKASIPIGQSRYKVCTCRDIAEISPRYRRDIADGRHIHELNIGARISY